MDYRLALEIMLVIFLSTQAKLWDQQLIWLIKSEKQNLNDSV